MDRSRIGGVGSSRQRAQRRFKLGIGRRKRSTIGELNRRVDMLHRRRLRHLHGLSVQGSRDEFRVRIALRGRTGGA